MKGALNHVRFRAQPLRPVREKNAILFLQQNTQRSRQSFTFEEFIKWRREEVSPVKWIEA